MIKLHTCRVPIPYFPAWCFPPLQSHNPQSKPSPSSPHPCLTTMVSSVLKTTSNFYYYGPFVNPLLCCYVLHMREPLVSVSPLPLCLHCDIFFVDVFFEPHSDVLKTYSQLYTPLLTGLKTICDVDDKTRLTTSQTYLLYVLFGPYCDLLRPSSVCLVTSHYPENRELVVGGGALRDVLRPLRCYLRLLCALWCRGVKKGRRGTYYSHFWPCWRF